MPVGPPRASPSTFERFKPKDRAAWRRWLTRNHERAPGVWLVCLKAPHRQIAYADAVEEALCFGWIDSVLQPVDEVCYMQLFTPRKPRSQWSRLNKQRVKALTAAGLMTAAGLAAIAAAKRSGSWTALDAVEALTVPPEFARALDAHPQARARFDAFSPSSKKMYLHWISTAKRDETRAKRIAKSVALIAEGIRGPHMRMTDA